MRSNCHIRAWKHFVHGNAEWLAFRRTKFNKLSKHAQRWYWKPLMVIGIILQWGGSIITACGWWLRWGNWYHMIWILPNGEWWEYIPDAPKKIKVLPSIIFKGKEQKYN